MSDDATALIQRIAQAANNIGALANVGGCETAGMIISFLAAHPDRVEVFLRDGWIDAVGESDPWATGCLTFHRKDGKIATPQDLRISQTVRDMTRKLP